MYLLYVNPANKRLKNLLYLWISGYEGHRDMRKYLVLRVSTNALLFEEDPYALHVLKWLKFREGDDVRIFKVEELQ